MMIRNSCKNIFKLRTPPVCLTSKLYSSSNSAKTTIGLNTDSLRKLKYETKVPQHPIVSDYYDYTTEIVQIDSKTIQLLERLSLVELDSKEILKTLQDSIQFADRIINIDTTGIEPLYTVLENQNLELRDDQITDGNIKEDILSNAKIIEEDYFVAPPGNIPLEQKDKTFE